MTAKHKLKLGAVAAVSFAVLVIVAVGTDEPMSALRHEEFETSISNLIGNYSQFSGYVTDVKGAQLDLEQILCARDAFRFIQDAEGLRRKDAGSVCDDLFSKAFRCHTNKFLNILAQENDTNVPNDPAQPLAKDALGTAMFLAADMGRRDLLSNQFAQLESFRIRVGPELSETLKAHPKGSAFFLMISDGVPDNRFQVNVLRLAALRSGNAEMLKRVDGLCDQAGMGKSPVLSGTWDARSTKLSTVCSSLWKKPATQPGAGFDAYDWPFGELFWNFEEQRDLVRKLEAAVLD